MGMVGSMETKAPSGSTIMMAVFLQSGRNSLFFSILQSYIFITNTSVILWVRSGFHVRNNEQGNLGMLDEEHKSSLMSHGLQCRLNTT